MTEEETREARRKARKTLTQAGAEYADAYDPTSGAIVTGYVTIYEFTTAEGRYCLWLTGTGGDPVEDLEEGLDEWRVEGMVRQVLRDIYRNNTQSD